MNTTKLIVSPNLLVGDLPIHVACAEGLFATQGLEVEIIAKDHQDNSQQDVFARQKERLFGAGEATLYNACQWGCVLRALGSDRRARIVGKRAAVLAVAIVVPPDSLVQTPDELAGEPIGVCDHTGSYYMGFRMLEGFLGKDQVRLVHAGHTPERYQALLSGDPSAVILQEPFISLAEKHGARTILESYFIGADIVNVAIERETIEAFHAGVRAAVRRINRDPAKYAPIIIEGEGLSGELEVDELRLDRLRYVDPQPYTAEEFEAITGWMGERAMIQDAGDYTELLDGPRGASAAG